MVEEEHQSVSEEGDWGDAIIDKILGLFQLTSGRGLITGGGVMFILFSFRFGTTIADNVYQEQVRETFLLQAELALLIVGIGILIKEVKHLGK
jgi:hypothetical protein